MTFTWPYASFYNVAVGSELSLARIVYDDEENAVVRTRTGDQSVVKSEQRQITQPTEVEDVRKRAGLCELWPKSLEEYSLCNVHSHITDETAQNTNSVAVKI